MMLQSEMQALLFYYFIRQSFGSSAQSSVIMRLTTETEINIGKSRFYHMYCGKRKLLKILFWVNYMCMNQHARVQSSGDLKYSNIPADFSGNSHLEILR